jgi:antitoxin VapB
MANTAKLFKNGRSQAVRLPAEFRFDCKEVYIERHGEVVTLRPKREGWSNFFDQAPRVPEDFLAERTDLPPQERDLF